MKFKEIYKSEGHPFQGGLSFSHVTDECSVSNQENYYYSTIIADTLGASVPVLPL
jgi:hypothetical protein